MQINLIYDASAIGAPAAFKSAIQDAANYLDALITNVEIVNINVGWGETGGSSIGPRALASASPIGSAFTYAQVVSELTKYATTSNDLSILKYLPSTDPTNGAGFFVSIAQQQAWGLLPAASAMIAGAVGFSNTVPFSFNPDDRATPATYDLIGAAEHEITHALGRFASDGTNPQPLDMVMDLFRYTAPGELATSPNQPAYFSIDGGQTNLLPFDSSLSGDPGDWASNVQNDAFGYGSMNQFENISSTDVTLMDVLGFNVDATGLLPGIIGLDVADTTTGGPAAALAQAYTGPVSGLQEQYINITSDSLNITATTPNWFIHSGSGNDAIAVTGGTNVLDGGVGSNFLTGGTGLDTFFVDDRSANADVWSTVNRFIAGDAATVWGITPGNFGLAWVDGQGAAGYTGLTLHASAAGQATASLTLVGFASNALSDGELSVSYGTSGGSPYMYIHDNS